MSREPQIHGSTDPRFQPHGTGSEGIPSAAAAQAGRPTTMAIRRGRHDACRLSRSAQAAVSAQARGNQL